MLPLLAMVAPLMPPARYTPSNPPIDVKVPVEHLLHASFKMEPITRTARPTGQLKFALENGGVVLSEHDHLQSMDALAWN